MIRGSPLPARALPAADRGAASNAEIPISRWRTLVIAAMIAHVLLSVGLAWARFATFHNRTFDLALYGRMAWGVSHAAPWDPIIGGHFFGGHVPLVLWPLGWAGRWFGIVPVLLAAQSMAVAMAAWPLFQLAARKLGPAAGCAVALAWLLYPNLGHVTTYEMHPGTLAVWPLCAACDAFDGGRAARLAAFCGLAVACRASIALQTCLLGVLAIAGPRGLRRVGVAIALGSAAYFAFCQLWLQPRFGQVLSGSLDLHFGRWGGSPLGVLGALRRTPQLVLDHFGAARRLDYLPRVLAPFAFLPLLRPRWLLCALPPLALNLISEFGTAPELYSHYLTPALPPLAAGTVDGLVVLVAALGRAPALGGARARGVGPWALLLASASGSVLAGGLPWSFDFAARDFQNDQGSARRRAAVRQIGATASVQAPDSLLPHLCERVMPCRAPPPERGTEFVVIDITHRERYARREELLKTIEEPVARNWLARPDHQVVLADPELLVLRRGGSPRAGLARQYFAGTAALASGVALTQCLAVRRGELGERLWLEFVARGPCPADLAIRLGFSANPARVDLLFEGILSPAQLRAGDLLRSPHVLSRGERARVAALGLHVGVLRASGAPPRPSDPASVLVPVLNAAPAHGSTSLP